MKKMLFIYNPNAGTGVLKPKLSDVLDIFVKAGVLKNRQTLLLKSRRIQKGGKVMANKADKEKMLEEIEDRSLRVTPSGV